MFLFKKLSWNCFSMETGEEARVKTAANIFKSYCYGYRDSLSAGIICAGWDKYDGGQVRNYY